MEARDWGKISDRVTFDVPAFSNIMKIFERDDKVNFVDENNVLVGFDFYASCCENFGYFFSKGIPTEIPENTETDGVDQKHLVPSDLEGFVFDTTFCKEVEMGDEQYIATFRLTRRNEERFLTLYNCHNGYYGHGFEMKLGKRCVFDGCL